MTWCCCGSHSTVRLWCNILVPSADICNCIFPALLCFQYESSWSKWRKRKLGPGKNLLLQPPPKYRSLHSANSGIENTQLRSPEGTRPGDSVGPCVRRSVICSVGRSYIYWLLKTWANYRHWWRAGNQYPPASRSIDKIQISRGCERVGEHRFHFFSW